MSLQITSEIIKYAFSQKKTKTFLILVQSSLISPVNTLRITQFYEIREV